MANGGHEDIAAKAGIASRVFGWIDKRTQQ